MKLLKEDEQNYKIDYSDLNNFYRVKDLNNLTYLERYQNVKISDELANAVKIANEAVGKAAQIYYNEITKPKQEEENRKERERLDKSALKINLTKEQADLIDAVLGQLSDGYWENSKSAEKYWRNIHLDGNTLIVDLDKLRNSSYSDSWNREFNNIWKNPTEVKRWFARKAQIVHNADMNYKYNTTKLTPEQLDNQADYLDRGTNQTYRQVQDAINSLK